MEALGDGKCIILLQFRYQLKKTRTGVPKNMAAAVLSSARRQRRAGAMVLIVLVLGN